MHLWEKTLEVKEIFKGKILDVTHEKVELENGSTSYRELVHHNGGVCVVPLTDNGEVIMVEQFRYPFKEVLTEIPAGKLDDPGEEGILCAARELEEETGYRCDQLERLLTLRTTVAFCDEKIEIFVARNLIKTKQHLDEDEYVDVKAYTVEELKNKIFAGEIQDSKTIAAILAYEAKYGI